MRESIENLDVDFDPDNEATARILMQIAKSLANNNENVVLSGIDLHCVENISTELNFSGDTVSSMMDAPEFKITLTVIDYEGSIGVGGDIEVLLLSKRYFDIVS